MSRMLKIYAGAADVPGISESARIIEQYDAFVLAEASEEEAGALARKFPVEDITDHYELKLGSRSIDTQTKTRALGGASRKRARAEPLKPGPHHYIVQVIGPVKEAWLAGVRGAGATLREPMGNFAYIVLCKDSTLPKISGLPFVRWVGHFAFSESGIYRHPWRRERAGVAAPLGAARRVHGRDLRS
ncbi:MAG: hypothetical protein ACJ746_30735 [Bryobacteraceae bacterium]